MYTDDESSAPRIDHNSEAASRRQTPFIQDYSKFDPLKYLSEYYATIGTENKFLLEFYHNFYRNVSPDSRILEFGGGPTVYQLLSAGQKVKEIIFAEYLDCNRKEILAWLNREKSAVNWDEYLDYVLSLDNKIVSPQSREEFHQTVALKVTEVIPCDAYLTDVLNGYRTKEFDIVSSGFCLECIGSTEEHFVEFVRKVSSLVKQGGQFVMTALKNSECYKINDLVFPTFPVEEEYLSSLLSDLNFAEIRIRSVSAEHDQGYEGIIALTARRR